MSAGTKAGGFYQGAGPPGAPEGHNSYKGAKPYYWPMICFESVSDRKEELWGPISC